MTKELVLKAEEHRTVSMTLIVRLSTIKGL